MRKEMKEEGEGRRGRKKIERRTSRSALDEDILTGDDNLPVDPIHVNGFCAPERSNRP